MAEVSESGIPGQRASCDFSFNTPMIDALGSLVGNPQVFLEHSRTHTMRDICSSQPELGILSASVYPNAPVVPPQAEGSPTPILDTSSCTKPSQKSTAAEDVRDAVLSEDIMPNGSLPLAEKEPRRKRKARRAPRDSDDDDGSRKQRGRPRLDTRDETAADRRRTQIRLAQRAYRHRKETTMTELRDKVAEMGDAIEEMDKLFRQLRDNFLDSALVSSNAVLRRQLSTTADRFAQLVESSSSPHLDQDIEMAALIQLRQADSLSDEALASGSELTGGPAVAPSGSLTGQEGR